MCNWIKKLKHRVAYWLASDWIEDLETRLSGFLCEQTGGLLSKSYYTVEAMTAAANYRQQKECEECESEKNAERKAAIDALVELACCSVPGLKCEECPAYKEAENCKPQGQKAVIAAVRLLGSIK